MANKVAQAAEDRAYRDYLADGIKMLTKSNAEIVGHGSYLGVRYFDILNPKPEDTRTGEEIKSHILKKLRGGA